MSAPTGLPNDLNELLGLPTEEPLPKLNEQEAKFVDEYFKKNCNATAAAIACSLTPNTDHARVYGFRMLQRPHVAYTVEKRREELAAKSGFTAVEATREVDEAIEFAKATGNANAYVKGLELKSKIHGLLIDRVQHQGAPFSVNISMPSRESISTAPIDVTPRKELSDGRSN